MTRTLIDPVILRLMQGQNQIDQELPPFARRSNPIVRRELGIYWKTLPLELGLWVRILGIQAAVVLLSIPFPLLYSFVMPVVTVSILMMPVAFIAYAQALAQIVTLSVRSVLDERQNNTLQLILVTPIPLQTVLFSKLAASVWRQLDNLGLVMLAHVLLGLPLIVLQNAGMYSPTANAGLTALAIILALAASLARLFLEPIMTGAIGLLMGATASPRIVAMIGAGSLVGMYFLFINLLRLLPLPTALRLAVEIGLPLVLPVVITFGALVGTARILRRD